MDKGDNEMISGTVHRSEMAVGNPGNPQLGDSLMKVERPIIISQQVRKEKGKDGGRKIYYLFI